MCNYKDYSMRKHSCIITGSNALLNTSISYCNFVIRLVMADNEDNSVSLTISARLSAFGSSFRTACWRRRRRFATRRAQSPPYPGRVICRWRSPATAASSPPGSASDNRWFPPPAPRFPAAAGSLSASAPLDVARIGRNGQAVHPEDPAFLRPDDLQRRAGLARHEGRTVPHHTDVDFPSINGLPGLSELKASTFGINFCSSW